MDCTTCRRLSIIVDEYSAEVAQLRDAIDRAIKIIDVNLYHQREKVVDASSILKQALQKE